MRLISLISCLIFSLPSYASDTDFDGHHLCRHVQSEGGGEIGIKSVASADYVPGIDVHGNSLVSADVNSDSRSNFLNDPIVIPIQIDLLERSGLALRDDLFSEAEIGYVKIYQDGRIFLGEKNISPKIRSFCDNPPQEHRQKEPNQLPSSDKIEGQYP